MPSRRLVRILLVSALVVGAARLSVAAPERCDPVSAAAARRAAADAAAWLAAGQRPDGSYRYRVDTAGRDLGGYNQVRHAGVTLSLYQAGLVAPADRGLAWMLDRLARRDAWSALADGGVAPLGASALMLAALAERRSLTRDDRHDETMRALGRFLVSMQRGDGDFSVYAYPRTGAVDFDATSPYFAGEALWALARLHAALPDAAWQDAAHRAARFVAVDRDDRDFVPVPPLNDHWAAYGFAEIASDDRARPLADRVVDYARAIHARFHLLIRWEAQQSAGPPYSWTHGPGARAAALGTWVEGQAALARLARTDARLADVRDAALDSTRCGAAILVARQRSVDGQPGGAWFQRGGTRMDDQQHAISGLLALADLLETAPERTGR